MSTTTAAAVASSTPYLNNATLSFPYTIDYTDESLLQAGLRVVAREIVPGWKDLGLDKDEDLIVTVISGGITNLLYRVCISPKHTAHQKKPETIARDCIVRIYGRNTEVIIDRERDNRLFAQLSKLGFAPPYLGQFENGRVEGWLEAQPLTPEQLAQTGQEGEGEAGVDMVSLIAKEMRRMHSLPVRMDDPEDEKMAVLWKKMQEWAVLAKEISFPDNPEKQAMLEAIGLERLEQEMAWLKGQLLLEEKNEAEKNGGGEEKKKAQVVMHDLVFSHQDLLCGNILYSPAWQSPERVQFIDFEYGGYNHRGFDLGNHFCEYAGFDPDYEKSYPTKAQQVHFCKAYINATVAGDSPLANFADEGEEALFLEGMYVWVNRYACAAHLFWGYWAVIQAKFSPIDFDFLLYGSQRLKGYEVFKKKFFDY